MGGRWAGFQYLNEWLQMLVGQRGRETALDKCWMTSMTREVGNRSGRHGHCNVTRLGPGLSIFSPFRSLSRGCRAAQREKSCSPTYTMSQSQISRRLNVHKYITVSQM